MKLEKWELRIEGGGGEVNRLCMNRTARDDGEERRKRRREVELGDEAFLFTYRTWAEQRRDETGPSDFTRPG